MQHEILLAVLQPRIIQPPRGTLDFVQDQPTDAQCLDLFIYLIVEHMRNGNTLLLLVNCSLSVLHTFRILRGHFGQCRLYLQHSEVLTFQGQSCGIFRLLSCPVQGHSVLSGDTSSAMDILISFFCNCRSKTFCCHYTHSNIRVCLCRHIQYFHISLILQISALYCMPTYE